MRNRFARVAVAAVLLGSAVGAAALVWDVDRRAPAPSAAALHARVDPLFGTVSELALAQAGYLATADVASASLDRFSELLRETAAGTAALSAVLGTEEAHQQLQAFADSSARLVQADALARDHLRLGDPLSASHALFADASQALVSMRKALAGVRAAEFQSFVAARDAARRRAQIGLSAIALIWIAGVLLLARLPHETAPEVPPAPVPVPDPATHTAAADFAAVARLCSDIARVETTDALAQLLDRAASLLGARGVIVWVGAGEELFPVVVQGYDRTVVRRIGPVSVRGENATAAAWRTEQLQVVRGDESSQSAIVAPVVGPTGCSAVLAVELPHGREDDPQMPAIVTMLAAQLSSLVAGWPGASVMASKRSS